MQLPTNPTRQLTNPPTFVSSSIPDDPNGNAWETQSDPYAVAVASCKNLENKGFAVNTSTSFLVEVDLTDFEHDPNSISTALPSGSCAGISTSFSCNNGAGVTFFPLTPPPV
jgi:hypothetical protein